MKLRVGIIGAGENTRLKHIPLLQEIDDVEISAIANRSLKSSQRVCTEFNIPKACEDWQEIIKRSNKLRRMIF